jgi:hypothetical protein
MAQKLPIQPVPHDYEVFDNVWLTLNDMLEIGIRPGEEIHIWSECEKSEHILARCLPWIFSSDKGKLMVNTTHIARLKGKQCELKEVYVEKAAFKHKLRYEKNFRNDFYALLIATFSSIFLATKDILKFYLADTQVSIITSVFGFIVIMLSLLRLFLKIG